MKLMVEILYRDDKTETIECVSLPEIYDVFVLLHLINFEKRFIHKDGIAAMKNYFV